MSEEVLARHDVALVRAGNPGPFTLEGSNTWIVGRDPAWVVDPGPDLPDHVRAVADAVSRRGGLGGVALTHGHGDHAGGLPALLEAAGTAPVGALEAGDTPLRDGDRFGPFVAVPTPGHSPDHLAFVAGAVCFTGDAVLGHGSVFVTAALGDYLDALRRLRALPLAALCPGHGPVVTDPAAKLDEYVEHRLERERRLLEALALGLEDEDDLLDAVWDDAPSALRGAAAITLRAHLRKLRDEGRL
jgi:glyoxylase-like metal-dependent hydrolase (beta-lactamase superfamily II)